MAKKNNLQKRPFSEIVKQVKQNVAKKETSLELFISEGIYIFMPDKYVKFRRERRRNEIKDSDRPLAVIRKNENKMKCAPGTTKFEPIDPFAVNVPANVLWHGQRPGRFLMKYTQTEDDETLPLRISEIGNIIPEPYWSEMKDKYEKFINSSRRRK
jgi:hypothetical protein